MAFLFGMCLRVSSGCLGCPGSGSQSHFIYSVRGTPYRVQHRIWNLCRSTCRFVSVRDTDMDTPTKIFLQSTFDLQWTSKVIGNYELQQRQTRCAPYIMKVESKGDAFVNLSKRRNLSIRTNYTSMQMILPSILYFYPTKILLCPGLIVGLQTGTRENICGDASCIETHYKNVQIGRLIGVKSMYLDQVEYRENKKEIAMQTIYILVCPLSCQTGGYRDSMVT